MKCEPKLFENGIKVRTGEVRLSYAHLFQAHAAQPDQKEAYSAALLIPKSDTKTISLINQAIENAKQVGREKKGWKDPVFKSPKFHNPLRDGEEKEEDEVYQNMMFVNAKSYNNQPTVLDSQKNKIEDASEVYSGCWAQASVSFYPFDVSGNKGIACGLNGVQKTRDDEALSGGGNAADDFEGEDEDDDFLN